MQNSLSYQFQFVMVMLAVFFWLLNWIPGLNVITNAMYWMIMLFVFFYKYWPIMVEIAESGVGIGITGAKIGVVWFVAFVLGEIPFISMLPWDLASNWLTNRWIKQLCEQVEKIKEQTEQLKSAWQSHWRRYRREPEPEPQYIDEQDEKGGEQGFKDPNAVVQ